MDEAELSAQWLDVYPRAQRLLKHDAESGNKNKDAWRLALQRLSLARGGHPTAALRSALVQYLVFGASSSGVEQDFSKLHLGLGYVRGSALPSTEEFAAKAILDARQQEDKVRLVRLARITWTSCFGQARAASAQERLDKGLKKRKQEEHDEGLDTEAAFLRKRRRAELAAASADAPLAEASSSEGEDLVNQLWTDKHQAELEFQQKKLRQRKIQALAENVLLDDEKDDGLALDMENCRRNLLQREAERRRKFLARMRLEACRSPTEVQADLRGKKTYLAVPATPQLRQQLFNLRITERPSEAEVVVCEQPGKLTDCRLRLLSGLKGCYEVSAAFVLTGRGVVLKMRPAFATKRVLLVSSACARHQPKFWRFLRDSLPENHKWTLHTVPRSGLSAANNRYQKGLAWTVVLPREVQHEDNCLREDHLKLNTFHAVIITYWSQSPKPFGKL